MNRSTLPLWLSSRWVPVVGGVVAAVVVGLAIAFLAYKDGEIREASWSRVELYAQVFEDHANRTLGGLGVAMDTAAENLALQQDEPDGALQAVLQQQSLQGLPFLRSLSLVASDGRILASSNPALAGRQIDRSRLMPAGQSAGIGPLLPVRDLGDLDGQNPPDRSPAALLPVVQPLDVSRSAGGTSLKNAWLVAALNPDFFANHYQRLLDATELRASLVTYQGQLVAASDDRTVATGTVLSHPLFRHYLPDRERGRIEGPGLEGTPGVMVYRSARLYPLALVVEMPERVIAAQLQAVMRDVGIGVASVLALLAALFALAWRSLRSHEAAQQALDAARDAMAAQLAFTDLMFELSPIPIFVKDAGGRFLRINHAFSDLTGLRPEAVTGRRMADLLPVHLASPHEAQEQRAVASAQPATYEEPMLDREGRSRDTMVRITPYTGREGRMAGVIGCLMDISDFREAQARTLEAKDAAERANATKTEFLANMSHELRTPLQSIIGFSELGVARSRGDGRVQGMFSDIHAAGQRMLALVNDLLDLSRLESTVGDIRPRPMDLVPTVREVIGELGPLAAPRRVRFTLQVGEQPLPVMADGFRLEQVLRNVLANALRFSPEAGEVIVRCATPRPGECEVQIVDQGPGVPPDELESIFEAFVQSSRTKSGAGGTGLGLAICRKIMQAHGGRIVAENRPEGGAVFTITLPVPRRT